MTKPTKTAIAVGIGLNGMINSLVKVIQLAHGLDKYLLRQI